MSTETPYPDAALIARARKARRTTIPKAAAAAGISQQRWAQIEQSKGKQAPPETIAHMAHAVGITSDRLVDIRPEAAEFLTEIELQESAGTDEFERRVQMILSRLPAEERTVIEEMYRQQQELQAQSRSVFERLILLIDRRGHRDGDDAESSAAV